MLAPERLDSTHDTPARPRLAYSVSEAAEQIDVSRSFVYKLIRQGTLPSVELDGRRLIRHEALVALLEDRERS